MANIARLLLEASQEDSSAKSKLATVLSLFDQIIGQDQARITALEKAVFTKKNEKPDINKAEKRK